MSAEICLSMVGAKQLRTLGLSWFRPGPYVQQGCARGTLLLRTGVPVEGWLQARRERRRGLQVPRDVIEVSANIVGKNGERVSACCPSSRVCLLRLGGCPSFYRPRRGQFDIRAALFLYVLRYGEQCRRVDGRPDESCSSHDVVACPVLEQGRLRGWRRGG
jgi:hypothetical protein